MITKEQLLNIGFINKSNSEFRYYLTNNRILIANLITKEFTLNNNDSSILICNNEVTSQDISTLIIILESTQAG